MLNLNTILPRLWAGKSQIGIATRFLVLPILALASLPYRTVVAVRNCLYDRGLLKQTKLPCPVVSIGNITVGGTGKTPLTMMLANLLRERGYKPAILSRGYGGAGQPLCIVSDGNRVLATVAEAGDEPLLIALFLRDIPVITGADRIRTGEYAIRELGADILILDDAFQHRRLFRDLDIVLIRESDPFGNGHLLPHGPLRESLTEMKRADIIVVNGTSHKTGDTVHALYLPSQPHAPFFQGYYRPTTLLRSWKDTREPPESLRDKKICAFAGIANPTAFRQTLESLGGEVVAFLAFPDHHPYTTEDIEKIQEAHTASAATIIVTTEKDGMRLADYPTFLQEVFLLRVEMDILPSREEFAEIILKKLKPPVKAAP